MQAADLLYDSRGLKHAPMQYTAGNSSPQSSSTSFVRKIDLWVPDQKRLKDMLSCSAKQIPSLYATCTRLHAC